MLGNPYEILHSNKLSMFMGIDIDHIAEIGAICDKYCITTEELLKVIDNSELYKDITLERLKAERNKIDTQIKEIENGN